MQIEKQEQQPIIPQQQEIRSKIKEDIRKQVQFYFSDVNLPTDAFLQKQLQVNAGWLPFKVLLQFNRIKEIIRDCTSSRRAKHRILVSALRECDEFKINKTGIRKKNKQKMNKKLSNILYLQAKVLSETILHKLLQQKQIVNYQLKYKRNSKWGFLYCEEPKQAKQKLENATFTYNNEIFTLTVYDNSQFELWEQKFKMIKQQIKQNK